jgi:hypothetical protein
LSNVGSSESVTHYISAAGQVWQWNGITFVTGGVYNSSLSTIGNADLNKPGDWPGFNFNWKYGGPYWSLGLYKVTNSKQTDQYFYLDARDSDFGGGTYLPDFNIYFDNADGTYNKWQPLPTDDINNGEVVRIWDIHGQSPSTSGLQNYWSNVLVCVSSDPELDNVRLIWGKHPTFNCTSYVVYRSYIINPIIKYRVIASVNSNTYEYIDYDTPYHGSEPVYYYIKGYNGSSYSEQSNVVSTPISKGYGKEVINSDNNNYVYSLYQNSPNPFNPTTKITYQIPERGYVSLKVYDILGNEITTLIDEYKEAGKYTVKFDGDELISSIYFYILRSRSYVETRKMLLIR